MRGFVDLSKVPKLYLMCPVCIGSGAKVLEQKPWSLGLRWLLPVSQWSPLPTALGPRPHGRAVLEQQGPVRALRALRGPCGLSEHCGAWVTEGWFRQRSRLPLLWPLCKCQQRLPPPCLDAAPSLSLLCAPRPSSFLSHGSPRSSAELSHEISNVGTFDRLRLRHVLGG